MKSISIVTSSDLPEGPKDTADREMQLELAAERVRGLGFGPTLTGAQAFEKAVRHVRICAGLPVTS